jgi:lantibiotic modifying enzyme
VPLFEATGEARFRNTTQEAFRYERSFYSAENKTWPDFRDSLRPQGSPPALGVAWCHGAPGIALSRLRTWRVTGALEAREEAEIAIRTTKRVLESPGAASAGFSLSHGCAGNADVLLDRHRDLGAPELRQAAEKIG